jgi:uncharacterized membrane protein YfcA
LHSEVTVSELALVPIVFLTSCLTAVIGLGGGVLLLMLMPGLVPAAAILPLHALTQLASNLSRAAFDWRAIDLRIVPAFSAGALAGSWLGAEIYRDIDLSLLPAFIGLFIIVFTWLPLPVVRGGGNLALALLGFVQTGLGMVAGATGPLGAAVLLQRNRDRDWLVVNTAVYMTLNHALRVMAYFAIGFSYAPWWPLVTGMVLAGICGSWVGTRLRGLVPRRNFHQWFRLLVSVLAVRMILMTLW